MTDRPEFSHKRERHGLVGPFSGRQLTLVFAAVLIAVVVLIGVTTPLGNTAGGPGHRRPEGDGVHHLVAAADRAQGRGQRARIRRHARRRIDLPADRPRRQADPAGRPARQGRLGQLLGDVVPAVPVGGADPARPCRSSTATAGSCSSPSASRRRRRPMSPTYADRYQLKLHDRVRWVGRDLPGLQGLRAADAGVHRPERGDRLDRRGAAGRGLGGGADRADPAVGRSGRVAERRAERQPGTVGAVRSSRRSLAERRTFRPRRHFGSFRPSGSISRSFRPSGTIVGSFRRKRNHRAVVPTWPRATGQPPR